MPFWRYFLKFLSKKTERQKNAYKGIPCVDTTQVLFLHVFGLHLHLFCGFLKMFWWFSMIRSESPKKVPEYFPGTECKKICTKLLGCINLVLSYTNLYNINQNSLNLFCSQLCFLFGPNSHSKAQGGLLEKNKIH